MQGGKYQTSPYQYHGNQHKNDGGGGHGISPFIGIELIWLKKSVNGLMVNIGMIAFDAT